MRAALFSVGRPCKSLPMGFPYDVRCAWFQSQLLPNRARNTYHTRVAHSIRILLLADSHLGFDLPTRERVRRRRRGHDFLANYATALEPALAGEVDLVVH